MELVSEISSLVYVDVIRGFNTIKDSTIVIQHQFHAHVPTLDLHIILAQVVSVAITTVLTVQNNVLVQIPLIRSPCLMEPLVPVNMQIIVLNRVNAQPVAV